MGKSWPMMQGLLPPSSRVTGVRLAAAARMMWRPTVVEPVNSRWSNGRLENAWATSTSPLITATCSSGKVSAISFSSSAPVRGVASLILIITRLPAARAVISGTTASWIG